MAGPIPSNTALFFSDINAGFGTVYDSDPLEGQEFGPFLGELPVTTEQLVIVWHNLMPKARIWYGSRVASEASLQTVTYVPRPYEITYAIDQFIKQDDIHDVYRRILPDLVRQTRRWQALETRDLLENAGGYTGAAQNGFDGLTYFNTAHLIDFYNPGLGTYCNDFTNGGQTISYAKTIGGTYSILTGGAFGVTAFKTLVEYMHTIKGEDGERLGVKATDLMHPPQLIGEVEVVLKNTYFSPPAWGNITSQVGAAENAWKRYGVTPRCNEFLNDPQNWYLGDTSRGTFGKPVMFGLREAWTVVPRTAATDPVVFDMHKELWGGRARGMPFWGFSWLLFRSGP
jgi:phage major head subunit gpT-like protein